LSYDGAGLTSFVMGPAEARHVSVFIDRPVTDVYRFASDVGNMAKWATGLGGSIDKVDGEWIASGPIGRVKVRMAKPNAFGVLDHDVVLESGTTVKNPVRVLERGGGSLVVFTLFRQPGVSDDAFEADVKWVEKDLNILKKLLEK
jgi:hypothetical protein